MGTFQDQLREGATRTPRKPKQPPKPPAELAAARSRASTMWEREFLASCTARLDDGHELTTRQTQHVLRIAQKPNVSLEPHLERDENAPTPVVVHLSEYLARVRNVGGEIDLEGRVQALIVEADSLSVSELEFRSTQIEREFADAINRCRPLPRLSPWSL